MIMIMVMIMIILVITYRIPSVTPFWDPWGTTIMVMAMDMAMNMMVVLQEFQKGVTFGIL